MRGRNGTEWAVDPAPAGGGQQLNAVACGTSSCMAVGNGIRNQNAVTWTERWDGRAWRVVPSPNPSPRVNARPELDGVSCVAARCIAVGGGLTEGFDGTRWTILPTPPAGIGEMGGVSCTSAAACTAVGSYNTGKGQTLTMALRWNGSAWSLQRTADPRRTIVDGLFGVSCPTATSCTAVGSNINDQAGNSLVLAEGWDGTTWALESTPSPAR